MSSHAGGRITACFGMRVKADWDHTCIMIGWTVSWTLLAMKISAIWNVVCVTITVIGCVSSIWWPCCSRFWTCTMRRNSYTHIRVTSCRRIATLWARICSSISHSLYHYSTVLLTPAQPLNNSHTHLWTWHQCHYHTQASPALFLTKTFSPTRFCVSVSGTCLTIPGRVNSLVVIWIGLLSCRRIIIGWGWIGVWRCGVGCGRGWLMM